MYDEHRPKNTQTLHERTDYMAANIINFDPLQMENFLVLKSNIFLYQLSNLSTLGMDFYSHSCSLIKSMRLTTWLHYKP